MPTATVLLLSRRLTFGADGYRVAAVGRRLTFGADGYRVAAVARRLTFGADGYRVFSQQCLPKGTLLERGDTASPFDRGG